MEEDSIPPAAFSTDSKFSIGRSWVKSTFMWHGSKHSDCKRTASNMMESSSFDKLMSWQS